MAPQKRTQFNVASDSPAWAGDENNADINDSRGSQGSVDHIVKDMANALNESTKKRRRARRDKIEKEYRLEIEQLQALSVSNLRRISSQNSKFHKERLEILNDLMNKRDAIEKSILQSTARLEKAYSSANEELQTVLAARIKNVKETSVGSRKA